MLFVSQKEPLNNTETLPDTSLHNVRKHQQEPIELLPSPCSSSNSSTFFHSSEASLPKLTKEQFDLHREFLRLGSLLLAENVNLFHQALKTLSAKHDLQISTPATSVSAIIPPSKFVRQRAKEDEFVAPRQSNRKYILPEGVAEKEFYQCMVCKERRATNSFGSTHTHDGCAKSCLRWYCPLCDAFFAVTHRGYHLKSRHSDILIIAHSEPVTKSASNSVENSVSSSLKRPLSDRSSDVDEFEVTPPEKIRHTATYPSPSAVSVDSVDSTFSSNWDASEEDKCLSMRSMVFSSPVEDQELFNEQYDCENHLFPVEEQSDDQPFLAFSDNRTESSLSF